MQLLAKDYERNLNNRVHYSQAGQDLFAVDMMEAKKGRTYIEIGGAHPFESNNTHLLESLYNWNGFSIEYDQMLCKEFNENRNNECVLADAITFDYKKYLIDNSFPKRIDYLSLDIDPAKCTFQALKALPFDDYRFSTITYEHEYYINGPEFMESSRAFLEAKGYKLVAANVNCYGRDFEDWWVDESFIPESVWRPYLSSQKEFSDLILPST